MSAHPDGDLPYGGQSQPNSGHAGSDTSADRAVTADRKGRTAVRQRQVLSLIFRAGPPGMTVRDVRLLTQMHHGQASSVLTALHKSGKLARLAETRDKCKIYVLPHEVGDRDTEEQGDTVTTQMLRQMYELLNQADTVYARQFAVRFHFPEGWHEQANDVMRRYESTHGRSPDG